MMLVLAVRTDTQRVYRRALDYFTEAELAEAFAATRRVASPAQLRAFMKRDPRDLSLLPRFSGLRFYTFPGGCATYRFSFGPGSSPLLAIAADSALSFVPRPALVDFVRRTEGLALCGRGAACSR